jgi:hypothetical protein
VLIKSFGSRPRANVIRAFLHRYTTLGNFTSLFFLHESQVTTTCNTTIYMSVQLVTNTYFYLIEQQQWLVSRCHDYMNHDRTTVIPYAPQSRETSASDSLVGLPRVTAAAHPAGIVASALLPC